MPVRVVIREPTPISAPATPYAPRAPRRLFSPNPSGHSGTNAGTTIPNTTTNHAHTSSLSFRRRTQDLVRRYDAMNNITARDISASNRLSGYLFVFTSYVVLLLSASVSSVQDMDYIQEHRLSEWKLQCAFWGSATFVGLSLVIIAVHFDTLFLHKFWRVVFQDGSLGELSLCGLLLLGSLFLVYVVTSRDGLGGFLMTNSNAYFSSWLGFFACAHTLQTCWCKGGGGRGGRRRGPAEERQSLEQWLRSTSRETNFYWVNLLFFSMITLLSVLDVFLTGPYDIQWIMVISSIVVVGCCILALLMNMACINFVSWYKLEGLIIFALSGYWSWVVFTMTGVNGLVHGPSNAYFGVWGSFFFAISTFGSWLKEHRLFIVT